MTAGSIVVWGLMAAAGLLAVPAVSHASAPTTLSLIAASMAFTGMGIALFLATRPPFIERAFGGLDRLYRTHRSVGIAVLCLILVHYFVTPEFSGLTLSRSLAQLAREMGEYAFYGFCLLLVLSLVKVIPKTRIGLPYHLWRLSHRLIGVLFLMAAFHQTFIKRPYDGTAAIAAWLNIVALVGTGSFLYTQLLPWLRTRRYRVTEVERHPGATVIGASPVRKPLEARPGQFGFLRVRKSGLRESHPFTIAGLGEDGRITFAIKPLGDFTRRLRDVVAVGDVLVLEGGYGRFDHRRGGARQIWLAGGIGVTPFLAMARRLGGGERQRIHMIYCVASRAEALGLDVFEERARAIETFTFTLHETGTSGRLDAAMLATTSPVDPKGADLWFCGPAALRTAIVKGLRSLGKPPARVEFEAFEFR